MAMQGDAYLIPIVVRQGDVRRAGGDRGNGKMRKKPQRRA